MEEKPRIQPADRIANFKPYFFASLNARLGALKARNVDVIRIDMGSPDLPPTDVITDELVRSARRTDTHGYSPSGGTDRYKQAVSEYYKKRFDVEIDPRREVIALLGSKEGLFNAGQVLLNPGDVSLVPDPGYPVYTATSQIAGAEIVYLPLLPANHYLPDLEAISEDIAKRARIIWLNYPNNPTGAIAPFEFLEKVVGFAKKFGIVICHDAPYTDICFDGYVAPSILQIPGAKDVTVEFNSLSKTYNMAGWRLGMAVGNRDVIGYLSTYKSQMDSSSFTPLLEAGATALLGDQTWISERNLVYKQRRDLVVDALTEAGFEVVSPQAAIYVWAGLPKGVQDSTDFCTRLLEDTGVSTTPGVVYGPHGEGYLRISLGTETRRIEEAMLRVMEWVKMRMIR